MLHGVRSAIIPVDELGGNSEAPAVAVDVAEQNWEDVFIQDGGCHMAFPHSL